MRFRERPCHFTAGFARLAQALAAACDGAFPKLIGIALHHYCAALGVPLEFDSRTNDEILEFMRGVAHGGEDVCAFKLLLTGVGGSGKTQLANRLAGGAFNTDEGQTNGVATREVQISAGAGAGAGALTAYVWDCGGQRPFQHTHPIFFSRRRSVFLAVYRLRHGCLTVVSFLKDVSAHAPDAPVVLVGAWGDESFAAEDPVAIAALQQQFPQIVEATCAVSSKDGAGYDELRLVLESVARAGPARAERVPKAWAKLKDTVGELDGLHRTFGAAKNSSCASSARCCSLALVLNPCSCLGGSLLRTFSRCCVTCTRCCQRKLMAAAAAAAVAVVAAAAAAVVAVAALVAVMAVPAATSLLTLGDAGLTAGRKREW